LQELSEDESELLPKKATVKRKDSSQPSKGVVNDDDVSVAGSDDNEYDGGGDENPWLGCVCGKTHPHPIKVFWVQCEGCDAWYNVAEECVGFDANKAEELDEWLCWSCNPPVAGLEF